MRIHRFSLVLLCLLGGCISAPSRSTSKSGSRSPKGYHREIQVHSNGYIRYDGTDDVAGDLEFAARTFESDRYPVKVTLLPMIHMADESFYRSVENRIANADCVITEGVHGKQEQLLSLGKALGAVDIIRSRLDLVSQKENFQQVRGVPYYWGDAVISDFMPGMVANDVVPSVPPLFLVDGLAWIADFVFYGNGLFGRRKSDTIRHLVAQLMVVPQDYDDAILTLLRRHRNGVSLPPKVLEEYRTELEVLAPSALISEYDVILEQLALMHGILICRNDRLFTEIEKRLADGNWNHIVIPWGAGHMWDIEERLADKFGYRLTAEEWLPAWKVQTRNDQ
ncbi:MAG: hypothetical protein ACI8XD_001518 [Thermoproteota archaeon]|jgi:hypothetical protein